MSRRKHKPSLEAELIALAQASDPRDKQRRSRVQVLARILWNKSLNGDANSIKQLLDRLPAQSGIQAEHSIEEPTMKVTSYEDITNALRALVEGGLVPIELFEMYRKKTEGTVEH
jgi:hypothetical protein